MPRYFDAQGKDITHWVETLLEKEKAVNAYREEVLVLKAEIKRLKTIPVIKKKKEIE